MSEIKGYISMPFHGESAYEIALRHGYEGTEAEWVESLGFIPDKSIGKEKLAADAVAVIEEKASKEKLFDTETIVIPAKEASPNLLNPEAAVRGVRITSWSANTNKWTTNTSSADYSYVIIPVVEGHKYRALFTTGGGYTSFTFYFASGTEANIDALTYISTSTGLFAHPTDETLYAEAPEGANYLVYNNNSVSNMIYDYTEHSLLTQWVEYSEATEETTEETYKVKEDLLPDLGIEEIAEKANSNEEKIAKVEASKTDGEVWEDIVCEWAGGHGYNYDGTLYTPQSDDEYTWGYPVRTYMSYTPQDKPIEVSEGEVWKTQLSVSLLIKSNSTGEDLVGLCPAIILDENDNVVYAHPSGSGVQEIEIEIPAGGKKMFLTYRNAQPFKLQKKAIKSMGDSAIEALEAKKARLKTDIEAHYRLYRRNRPTLQQSDKAYIIFVCDDLNGCVSTYADMFIERNIPLCLATPPDKLRQAALNGTESCKQVAQRVEANGGEILTHHGNSLNVANFNFDEAYNTFVTSKERLEAEGFTINGTILVGGQTNDDIEALKYDMEKWTSYLYEYSDRCGVAEPYYHARQPLYSAYLSYEQYQAKLATAIANKELIVFYWHDADNISDADLAQYLDYFKTLSSDDIEAVTYKTYYDKVLYNVE